MYGVVIWLNVFSIMYTGSKRENVKFFIRFPNFQSTNSMWNTESKFGTWWPLHSALLSLFGHFFISLFDRNRSKFSMIYEISGERKLKAWKQNTVVYKSTACCYHTKGCLDRLEKKLGWDAETRRQKKLDKEMELQSRVTSSLTHFYLIFETRKSGNWGANVFEWTPVCQW